MTADSGVSACSKYRTITCPLEKKWRGERKKEKRKHGALSIATLRGH